MPRKQTIFPGNVYDTTNGKISIVEYHHSDCIDVLFLETGYLTSATAAQVRKGLIKDKLKPTLCGVGYLGVGGFTGKTHPKLYKTWNNMINRCYNSNTIKENPSYEGCTVCHDWFNFQKFCEDIQTMDGFDNLSKGYHLDKDLKVPGNKVYSKDFCSIISISDNARESAKRRWSK